jgi:hypothetical protein
MLTISCAQKSNELKQELLSSSDCLEFMILVSDSNYFLHLTNNIKADKNETDSAETKIDNEKAQLIINKLDEYKFLDKDNIHNGNTELKSNDKIDNKNVKLSILVSSNDQCEFEEFFIVSSNEEKSKNFLNDIGKKLNYEESFKKLISEM